MTISKEENSCLEKAAAIAKKELDALAADIKYTGSNADNLKIGQTSGKIGAKEYRLCTAELKTPQPTSEERKNCHIKTNALTIAANDALAKAMNSTLFTLQGIAVGAFSTEIGVDEYIACKTPLEAPQIPIAAMPPAASAARQ